MSELDSLEKSLLIYEELNGSADSRLDDFISPTRKHIETVDIFSKEAPFAQSKKRPVRLYLFKDLIITAEPTANKQKFTVSHYLSLRQCTFREVAKDDAEGHKGITLTHVSRFVIDADGVLSKSQVITPGSRMVTRVEKSELWFPSTSVETKSRSYILKAALQALAELDAMEMSQQLENSKAAAAAPAAAAATSSGGAEEGVRKQRSWAKKRATLTKPINPADIPPPPASDDGSESVSGTINGFSLADLEAKYKIDLKTPDKTPQQDRVEFEISFGEGPMGFSLGSGAGVGVIVGRLQPDSFAEMAGVAIGDRIVSLNNSVEIGFNMSWQDCVDKIKNLSRPITIKFERSAGRQVIDEDEDEEEEEETQSTTASSSSAASSSHTPSPSSQRKWANRRAQRAISVSASGAINLSELERVYNKSQVSGGENAMTVFEKCLATLKTEEEKACCHLLREIYDTEHSYVKDLRCLVGEYMLPLRRAMKRGRCKDISDGSKICEHNLIRSTCVRTSTESHPILNSEDMKVIFGNIETLMTVNSELLSVLDAGLVNLLKKTGAISLGDIAGVYAPAFQRISPLFKMYGQYCHQYQSAINRLSKVRLENQQLDEFLIDKGRKMANNFVSLNSLLIKPVQRICKYPLLFESLMKDLKKIKASPDLTKSIAELSKTADVVNHIAEAVNKQVGQSESMEKILEIFEELGGEKGAPGLIESHRRFVSETDFNFVDAAVDTGNQVHERLLYVFNDILIIAKSISGTGTLTSKKSSSTLGQGEEKKLGIMSSFSRKSLKKGAETKQFAKIEKQLEISGIQLNPIADAPADPVKAFGFGVKYVGKREEHGKSSTLKKSGTGKIITYIEKYEFWFANKEARNTAYSEIQKQIEVLEELEAGQKKAEIEVGAEKKERSWVKKGHSDSSGAEGLQALASKYNSLKM